MSNQPLNPLANRRVISQDFIELQAQREAWMNTARQKATYRKLCDNDAFMSRMRMGYSAKVVNAILRAPSYQDLLGPTEEQLEPAVVIAIECGGLSMVQVWHDVFVLNRSLIERGLKKINNEFLSTMFFAQTEIWTCLLDCRNSIIAQDRLTELLENRRTKQEELRKMMRNLQEELYTTRDKEALKFRLAVAHSVSVFYNPSVEANDFTHKQEVFREVIHMVNQCAELRWYLDGGKFASYKQEIYSAIHSTLLVNKDFVDWSVSAWPWKPIAPPRHSS